MPNHPRFWVSFGGPHGAKIEYMIPTDDPQLAWHTARIRLFGALGRDADLLREWGCLNIERLGKERPCAS